MGKTGYLLRSATIILAYGLLATTFAVVLSQTLDRHFDVLINDRIHFGGVVFTASRVLSPSVVRLFVEAGISERTSAMILVAVTTTALLLFFAKLLNLWGLDKEKSTLLAPFILIPMVWNYIILSLPHYPEDIPSVLFFTLGLVALAENKSIRFHVIFLLAIINRESAVFLVPSMFLMEMGRRKTSSLLLHSFVLIAVAFGIRLFLNNLIDMSGSSSSVMFEDNLRINTRFLWSVLQGNLQVLRMIMLFGGLWLLLPFCIGRVTSRVMLLTIMLPVFFVGMLIVGNLNGEARIFNEMIPVVTAPCILLLFARSK